MAGDETKTESAVDVMVADPIMLDGSASPRLGLRLKQMLHVELERLGHRVLPDSKLEELKTGAAVVDPRTLENARDILERGKEHYLEFELEHASTSLEQAVAELESILKSLEVMSLLLEALAYLGATHLTLGDEEKAQAAFLELLRRRPDHRLDADTYGPRVLDAFEIARSTARQLSRGEIAISSSPPLATVTVNGQPSGETPVTVESLIVGDHTVMVEAPDHRVWVDEISVTKGSKTLAVRLEPLRIGRLLEDLLAKSEEPKNKDEMISIARDMAQSAGVGSVILMGLRQSEMTHYLIIVEIDGDGQAHTVWTAVDDDYLWARELIARMAESLPDAKDPHFVDTQGTSPSLLPDFNDSLLGFKRLTPRLTPTAIEPSEPLAPSAPLMRRWWFWASILLLATGSGATYQAVRPPTIIQEPDRLIIDAELER